MKKFELSKETFKKINTLGELKTWVNFLATKIKEDTPILMQSDEEGNQVNKVLFLELYKDGLTFVPLEQF